MSVVRIGGRDYAAGLRWRSGRLALHQIILDSRNSGLPFFVRREGQVGYATGEAEHEGCPSLAAAFAAAIPADQWVAMVEGEDGRCAVTSCSYNALTGDEDRVFPDRALALAAVEAARSDGFKAYAPEGLMPGAEPLNWDEVAAAAVVAEAIAGVPFSRLERRHAVAAAAVGVAGLTVLAGWTYRTPLLELAFGPPEAPAPVVVVKRVKAEVSTAAFIDGCRAALRKAPPYLPAWKIVTVTCHAQMQDPEVLLAAPSLSGRPVLFARWRLGGESLPAAHRRLASARLASWYAGGVNGQAAWAVMELPAVVRLWEQQPTPGPELRRNIDLAFGLVATIDYLVSPEGETIKIGTAQTLDEIAARAARVPGFEAQRLTMRDKGGWSIEGQAAAPRFFLEPYLQGLMSPVEVPTPAAMPDPAGGGAS